jgi:transglutaminase-like putative cysteine protease
VSEPRARRLTERGSPWRLVACSTAIALAAIGSVAASRIGLPALVGVVAGAGAGLLAVLALPSLPTRRATVLVLGAGGLGALRNAAFPGADSGLMLLLWALGTMLALLFVDRADAETVPLVPGGKAFDGRLVEASRVVPTLVLLVAVAAIALVPTVTDHLGRQVWPGLTPRFDDATNAPSSLRSSDELDMTSRPRLSDKVVFTVDAPRADFWRGETFDRWDGQRWTRSSDHRLYSRRRGDTVQLALDPYDIGARRGTETRQTFRMEARYSSVLFAAPSPVSVRTDRVLMGRGDGSAFVHDDGFSRGGFGKGAVYTVTSRSLLPTSEDLRRTDAEPVPVEVLRQYTLIPASTTQRVRDLAVRVTSGEATTYDKVRALEQWLGDHTRYSLDAPLSPAGVDVVDDFLFNTRLGWCEQVASSMVVLARSAGIPARLATGFVPGERDRLTGRFVVRERDAHAWAEIYFPGIGWQGFDPTASVPLAGEAATGGSWLDLARRHALELAVLVAALIACIAVVPRLTRRWREHNERRQASWSARALAELERIGGHAGRPRAAAETPREYAHALAGVLDDQRLDWVGDALDTDAYSAHGAPPNARDATDAVLSSLGP